MIYWENEIIKSVKKGTLPKATFIQFRNAFVSIEATNDLSLFDVRPLKGREDRKYYRLRKGKYRAIFFLSNNDIHIVKLDKREDVYK